MVASESNPKPSFFRRPFFPGSGGGSSRPPGKSFFGIRAPSFLSGLRASGSSPRPSFFSFAKPPTQPSFPHRFPVPQVDHTNTQYSFQATTLPNAIRLPPPPGPFFGGPPGPPPPIASASHIIQASEFSDNHAEPERPQQSYATVPLYQQQHGPSSYSNSLGEQDSYQQQVNSVIQLTSQGNSDYHQGYPYRPDGPSSNVFNGIVSAQLGVPVSLAGYTDGPVPIPIGATGQSHQADSAGGSAYGPSSPDSYASTQSGTNSKEEGDRQSGSYATPSRFPGYQTTFSIEQVNEGFPGRYGPSVGASSSYGSSGSGPGGYGPSSGVTSGYGSSGSANSGYSSSGGVPSGYGSTSSSYVPTGASGTQYGPAAQASPTLVFTQQTSSTGYGGQGPAYGSSSPTGYGTPNRYTGSSPSGSYGNVATTANYDPSGTYGNGPSRYVSVGSGYALGTPGGYGAAYPGSYGGSGNGGYGPPSGGSHGTSSGGPSNPSAGYITATAIGGYPSAYGGGSSTSNGYGSGSTSKYAPSSGNYGSGYSATAGQSGSAVAYDNSSPSFGQRYNSVSSGYSPPVSSSYLVNGPSSGSSSTATSQKGSSATSAATSAALAQALKTYAAGNVKYVSGKPATPTTDTSYSSSYSTSTGSSSGYREKSSRYPTKSSSSLGKYNGGSVDYSDSVGSSSKDSGTKSSYEQRTVGQMLRVSGDSGSSSDGYSVPSRTASKTSKGKTA